MPRRTPYEIGRDREYKAKTLMESWFGCTVIRTAGSHSPADLLCGNGVEVFAVQVKSEGEAQYVDWDTLRRFAEQFQAIPTVLEYCTGGRWKVYLDGERFTQFTADKLSVR
jgi:Holliday junction resolvase